MIINKWSDVWKYTGVGAITIGLLVFAPVVTFGCAYIGGWLLKICVGDAVTNGLNLMLNTDRFTTDFIPLACATLATIGRYFKSSQTNNDK